MKGIERVRGRVWTRTGCGELSPKEKFKWAVKMVLQFQAVPGYRISDNSTPLSGIPKIRLLLAPLYGALGVGQF